MKNITNYLFSKQDIIYKDFLAKLVPNIDLNSIIGVRTKEIRDYAKELVKEDYLVFLKELPHKYFEENQLHAFIISEIKDYDECIAYLNTFLKYIDNWATCDQLSPKVFKKNTDKLLDQINIWIKSSKIYEVRFGINMLMKYYLDSNYKKEYLELVSKIKSNEYYINMMIAWFFATALVKQYDDAITYLENKKLDKWVHNKTIQKAIESYRITNAQKEYLKSLKIK